MTSEFAVLCATAVSIGTVHTLLGPDHYVPFAAMSAAGKWPLRKTIWITLLCGLGHVSSSVVLGMLGIALGLAVESLEDVEGSRANIAGWLLLGFGIIYTVSGLIGALRGRSHSHWHTHGDGTVHKHTHNHETDHLHVHEVQQPSAPQNTEPVPKQGTLSAFAPWTLFLLFLFGPCEPLIPLLMYPAARWNWTEVCVVTALFSAATLLTMLAMVTGLSLGTRSLDMRTFDRFGHAIAGMAITACGIAMKAGL